MDKTDSQSKAEVAALIETIKAKMPETYALIKRKAAAVGNDAYADVYAGLRGEVNRFYAFEAGHVVGTPFNCPAITADVAQFMVQFGVRACVLWSEKVARAGSCTVGTGSSSASVIHPHVGTPTASLRQGNSTLEPAPVAVLNKSPAISPAAGE